jgi:hypothetical protein
MSPMPPPPGMAGALLLGSGFSVTTASVVSSRPAMGLAFCGAVRVILASGNASVTSLLRDRRHHEL